MRWSGQRCFPIPVKLVFKVKSFESTTRFKTRMVCCGNFSLNNSGDNYAPTSKSNSAIIL